jgi:fructokinase
VQCLDTYADRLARGLAHVINVLDPQVVVLGGRLSNLEGLYEATLPRLKDYVFFDSIETRLVRAAHGDSSGVRGAARLWKDQPP